MNRKMTDLIVVGFALFSMFLGAGNLIFPPYLGLHAGETWLPALIGFLLTGVGLPLMTVYATLRSGGTIMTLARYVGRPFGRLLGLIVVLSIGPMFAIPRTAATTYEVGIATIVPSIPIEISSIVFFVIVWALTINRSKVVDRLGKYLTPFLLLTLFAIVVAAVINPIGDPGAAAEPAYNFAGGFTEGYQTMDALAASMFAGVALSNIVARGYNNREEQLSMSIRCGVIAAVLLGLVYCGLTYGGAGATGAFPADIDRSALLIGMTSGLLGSVGAYCLSVAVILACLTTAIGLISCTASYFHGLTGKFSYRVWAVIFTVVSYLIGLFGLKTIIVSTIPVLMFLYPLCVALVLLVFLHKSFGGSRCVYAWTIGLTFIMAAINGLETAKLSSPALEAFLKSWVPLHGYGLGWISFAVAGFVIGMAQKALTGSRAQAS